MNGSAANRDRRHPGFAVDERRAVAENLLIMHELSIAMDLVDEVCRQAENRGGLKVETVHLRLGLLAGVDKEALAFSYGLVCDGTPLQGSQLVVEDVAVCVRCSQCGTERTIEDATAMPCPSCPSVRQEIVTGQEIELSALEVAT